jgi:hypothetical protein
MIGKKPKGLSGKKIRELLRRRKTRGIVRETNLETIIQEKKWDGSVGKQKRDEWEGTKGERDRRETT